MSTKEPIAIVGSACRFPGKASSPSKLWDLLKSPRDIVSEFSKERLNLSAFYNADGEHHGSTNVKNQSYLLSEDISQFDCGFFSINPREAEALDPQQRNLLETVYESLESAGWPLEQVQGGQMAVFVGLMTSDWHDLQVRDPETAPTYAATGTARSIMSNRISYFFDLHGPSVTVDTACSSSLVALHQAVQAIRNGECPSAIVAGANLILDPWMFIAESTLHMLSPNSRSRMWDKSADGYARGEGFASMVVKSLSQAISDGDHIEAIIRETAVNSDGRTKGITMPSSSAQAALIQQTYRKAGLDPEKDRCQYFECHGTGTLAGDPVEANAIHDAFFADAHPGDDILYAGSIKTVVGHLEGTAGLAGVFKAALAVRNKIIPPNLHFEELNPAITPYYDRLCVPTEALPWPETKGPRRASVNSFGFGGTNAHAIIESFETPSQTAASRTDLQDHMVGPLVFSAHSEASLKALIQEYASYLETHPDLSIRDLCWTLDQRRSTLNVKAFFSGATRQALQDYIVRAAGEFESGGGDELIHRHHLLYPAEVPAVLGIFTGQGAQWATMGTSLIQQSPIFRASIERQQASLDALPDGPTYRIDAELMAGDDKSHIKEAAYSQTLCTALQVAMVDVLRAARVHLDAVIGHSSGEIAAVYAAGMISAHDAIRIAYYRGLHAKLASGVNGQTGSMMAVSITLNSAQSFCEERFKDRLTVAASNSPASVTLSGDKDAIEEAKKMFDEEKTFARVLVVDKAYHSHHMQRCADAYRSSLVACDIQVHKPTSGTIWISSVRGDTDLVDEDRLQMLAAEYWIDNLLSPVLFSQALERSCWSGPFELALEIGAHPALKGPSTQTLKSILGHTIPYASLMRRGDHEVEAFAGGIGYAWQHLGPRFVDLTGFRSAFETNEGEPCLIKDLPQYPWEHTRPFWKESRISRAYRLGGSVAHELLGRLVPDSWGHELRWRNVIRCANLPWLKGHVFQGQVLFPATGYISMAMEAARVIAGARKIRTIELQDFEIPKALVLKEDSDGVETIFKLSQDVSNIENTLTASFSCYVCHDEVTRVVERTAFGRLEIQLGEPSGDELPPRNDEQSDLVPVDINQFYESLEDLGLNYQGLFRGLQTGARSDGVAQVEGSWIASEMSNNYVIHPALLDTGFHAVFCAFASPATGQLWAPFLPTSIGRLTIDPNVSFEVKGEVKMQGRGFVTAKGSNTLDSEIQMFTSDGVCVVCAEQLGLRAMYAADESTDRALFVETVWKQDITSGLTVEVEEESPHELESIEAIERLCLHYWQQLLHEIKSSERGELQWFHQLQLSAAAEFITRVREDQHPFIRPEWLKTSANEIQALEAKALDTIDLQLVKVVGECLPGVLRGEISLLEQMLANDLLNQFYMRGLGLDRLNNYIAGAVQQIVHRHSRPRILEIGAGTGGTTRSIFDAIDDRFAAYMYTDISAGFFEKAGEKFKEERQKMTFKVLDIEKDPLEQGYEEHSYDIIVAANVLHATSKLRQTLTHTRKLLRPGGFLVLMEVTGDLARLSFIMGGLPGWWLGADEGRVLSPGVSPDEWDRALQATGFSGVSNVIHDTTDPTRHACSLLISQAVDDTFDLVREPFAADLSPTGPIILVGGKSMRTSRVTRECRNLLSRFNQTVKVVESIDAFVTDPPSSNSSILVLEELDHILLSPPVSQVRLDAFKAIFGTAKDVLWVTTGRATDSPHSNMAVAVLRTMRDEIPGLNVQSLDFARKNDVNAFACTETFLRLMFANTEPFASSDNLWTVEPEIIMDGEALMLPRIRPNSAANDRYNAKRRPILSAVHTKENRVELKPFGDTLVLHQMTPIQERLRIDVDMAVALPGIKPASHYLCTGTLNDSDCKAITLTTRVASCEYVSAEEILVLKEPLDSRTLRAVALQVVAQFVLAHIERTTVLFEAPEPLAKILAGSKDLYLAGQCTMAGSKDCISLHPKATRRMMKEALPRDLSMFIDFRTDSSDFDQLLDCRVLHAADVILPGTTDLLRRALDAAEHTQPPTPLVLTVQELAGTSTLEVGDESVIRWPSHGMVDAAMKPLDVNSLFREDRTYLLVGLTGELGQSLCRFMIRNGAKHIVMTSRNVDPDATWAQELNGQGASVKVFRMDVTDRSAVRQSITDIRKTAPPIAGVCNGAMVLMDSTLESMSVETMNNVLRPKVDGSTYLDELFANDDLDFFVLFSSMGTVMGNGGQSNYNAANLFMTGLASQRKQRGLAGSVIDIGFVTDVGYVARQSRSVGDRLRNAFWEPLSEKDVCQMFAEAIVAGRPDNPDSSQISMGIKPFYNDPNATNRPRWYDNPRFAQMVKEAVSTKEDTASSGAQVNIQEQLKQAATESEAAELLTTAFASKLEQMLQLSPGTVRSEVPLIDAGVDSLLAVEVRTWFLREIDVDVPVLTVLSGDTIGEICSSASAKFLATHGSAAPLKNTDQARRELESRATQRSTQSGQDRARSVVSHKSSVSAATSSGTDASREETFSPPLRGITRSVSPISDDSPDLNEPKTLATNFTRSEGMSLGQSRLWFLRELLPDQTTYNVAVAYSVEGPLQIARFRRAFATVVSHHEALRTCLFREDHTGELRQAVRGNPIVNFSHEEDDGEAVSRVFKSFQARTWNLEQGDLFGVTVVSHNTERHTAVFGYHHIAIDGFSWGLVLQSLSDAYNGKRLPAIPKHATDFAREEAQSIAAGNYESDIAFWRQEHSVLPDTLPLLPFARVGARQTQATYQSNTVTREIPKTLASAIKHASTLARVGPFHFHLAAIQTLYAKLTGVNRLCLGITDANRHNQDYRNTVGFFLNFMPLQFEIDMNDDFASLAKRSQRKVYDGLAHASMPFELILDDLKAPRSSTCPPLFQMAVNYRVASVMEVPMGECMMKADFGDDAKNPYDLMWSVTQSSDGSALLELTAREYLYAETDTARIIDAYLHLLEHFSRTTSSKIDDCTLFSDRDLEKSAAICHGPKKDFQWPATLSARVEEVCEQFPETQAIKTGEESVTYGELGNTVHHITASLNNMAVGSRIAVLCQPSATLIAAMLGTLRAGAVYVPLDLSLPFARHTVILAACGAAGIIHDATTADQAKALAAEHSISLVDASTVAPCDTVSSRAQPHDPAILLHTSGSTGAPKGIELTQAGCVNFIAGLSNHLGVEAEVVLQQTSLGFDMSLAQIFVALCHGGKLLIVPQNLRGNVASIASIMRQGQVTYTFQTPSEYQAMLSYGKLDLEQCDSWRYALLGGEKVSKQLRNALRTLNHSQLRILNCYGPTEITITASIDEISRDSAEEESDELLQSVGYACANYSVYILDKDLKPVPRGYPGQICIGGPGVALGYPNMPEQSKVKFVEDRFKSTADREQMHCTGDRGKMHADGRVIFLGREDGDTQVKLRGIRIELEEVALAVCRAASQISAAVVTVRGDPSFLVAHVTFEPHQELSENELQGLLRNLSLPVSVRPAIIIALPSMPMNANGKVDRRALEQMPLPELSSSDDSLSLAEGELRLIWEDVLRLSRDKERIGPDADFFLVGGNSLLLAQLQNSIRESMNLQIPIRDLYAASTLRDMSMRLTSNKEAAANETIDWIKETEIGPNDLAPAVGSPVTRKTKDLHILLTGGTSFLGAYVLRELLKDSTVSRVHAVAVDSSKQVALPESEKLVAYSGSLLHPDLGLSVDKVAMLRDTIDIIVHAGAIGHCMNNYASLRTPNFVSTRFLARIAHARKIPLHFLSSGRVALLRGDCDVHPVTVAEVLPVNDGSQGFVVSKWASERFLEQFSIKADLEVCIHRACAPIGDEAPNEDALNALLLYSRRMRTTPIFDNVQGYFDFEAVDALGASIARDVLHSQPASGVRFKHHSGEVKVPIDQIRARMEQIYGGSWDEIPVHQWLTHAKALGIEDMIASYLEAMIEKEETIAFPYLGN